MAFPPHRSIKAERRERGWIVAVEVPVMLSVCSVWNRTRHWFEVANARNSRRGPSERVEAMDQDPTPGG
jgi:hypothetical protein